MTFIDTHTHLYVTDFDTDRAEVVSRAREAGCSHILLPNINAASVQPMLAMCHEYPGLCFPMMGLHPEDVGPSWRQDLEEMHRRLLQPEHPYVGIGEVGLDFYWDRTYEREQQDALAMQVEWASDLDLPLMIHCRSAYNELLHLLAGYEGRGVFHCFGSSAQVAHDLLRHEGFMLGIGGILTFKKSHLPQVLADEVPLSRIVLETDAPYLAPTPHRGQRNETAYIAHIVQCLADIYHTTPDEVATVTTQNALKTFPRIAAQHIEIEKSS